MSDETDERARRYGKLWSRYTFNEYGDPVLEDEDQAELPPDETPLSEYGDDVDDKNVARVTTSLSRKVNIGDYNNVEAHFGVSLPCHVSEIPEGFEAARSMIEPRIQAFVDEVRGEAERDWTDREDDGDDDNGDDGVDW